MMKLYSFNFKEAENSSFQVAHIYAIDRKEAEAKLCAIIPDIKTYYFIGVTDDETFEKNYFVNDRTKYDRWAS